MSLENDGQRLKPVKRLWSVEGLAGYTAGDNKETEEIKPDTEVSDQNTDPKPPAGLPKSFWKSLGVGR